jgi:NTP pyrophosphatase (non-canonical NTP hydrolase)
MNNSITRERLEEIVSDPMINQGGEFAMMARMALAAMYSEPVADDYFASLVTQARARADKAMRKFPQPNYVLNKVAEESGEVIKAVIHYTEGREEWRNVEGEIIDNLAMLIRLVQEGDQVIGFTPPTDCRAAMLAAAPQSPGSDPATVPGKWIPVIERLPESDTRVLLYFSDYDGHIEDGFIGDNGDGLSHYLFDGDCFGINPTHWQPLPAATREAKP